ncbi:acyl-CoA reductase [Alteromonas macleodii]|uniref:acyl-CoA reductase n=1 Tax=Alteromonas macleodii TaxID=28108 RepID=UPI000AEF1787|nr:acyl-CoA reductase [Alteromonas macleodii]
MIPLFNDNSPLTWHIEAESLKQKKLLSLAEIRASVAGFAAFLLKQNTARKHPEIVALAFWFRQAHLAQITESMPTELTNKKVHRVFHIAPANVDTVFMYSVLLSVLCANQNIVRVSQRSGEVTWLLISLLKEYLKLPEGQVMANQVAVVDYEARQEQATEQLSNWCDLRVIWGGDQAIKAVTAIAPQTAQVCFPDRYSVALIQLDENSDINALASQFLTDLLPFTQQACSSPKAIYWLNTSQDIQQSFWDEVEKQLNATEHQFDISNKVEQQINFQYLAAAFGLTIENDDEQGTMSFARVQRVDVLGRCKVRYLTAEMLAAHTGNGLMLEQDVTSPDAIAFSAKLQTIACAPASLGIQGEYKRTTRLGASLEFDTVWDGIDLLQVFY